MGKNVSFLYANRNRDLKRIRLSLNSLRDQVLQNFNVIFVDYGSDEKTQGELTALLQEYEFVNYSPLPAQQLLWNKSKALNFAILQVETPFVFIADVDLIFHPEVSSILERTSHPGKFVLFKLGYLGKAESDKLERPYLFEDLKPVRFGKVNGMILTSKESLLEVNGLDEFFHFYGAEDEDLFGRLENAGYERTENPEELFFHNWHPTFSGSEDKLLTGNPRMKNIMRINQKHYLKNLELGVTKPLKQEGLGIIITSEERQVLNSPTKVFRIPNITAHIEHFLREELPRYMGEVVKTEFVEDPYFNSPKYKIKKHLGKQTQPYISMKAVNDMVLKEILYNYRSHNYGFEISKDLKRITFVLQVK